MRLAPDLLRVPAGAGALHVARWGHDARHVVLLHGFGTHGFVWRHVGPTLARAGVAAWALDLLGHGESDRPADAEFGISAQADVLQRALGALRLGAVTLVGLDLGGAVAMRLAATYPDRVAQLVLVNPMTPTALPSPDVAQLPADAARLALRLGQGVLRAAVSDPAAAELGLGLSWQGGAYLRVLPMLALGAARDGDVWRGTARGELTVRFSPDPFAQQRWAPYAAAGLAVGCRRETVCVPTVVARLGIEGPLVGSRWRPAFEVGVGGGVQLAVAWRRGRYGRR